MLIRLFFQTTAGVLLGNGKIKDLKVHGVEKKPLTLSLATQQYLAVLSPIVIRIENFAAHYVSLKLAETESISYQVNSTCVLQTFSATCILFFFFFCENHLLKFACKFSFQVQQDNSSKSKPRYNINLA